MSHKLFVVYDRGRPAKYPHCNVHKSWKNCVFEKLADAQKYVIKWLGWEGEFNNHFPVNTKYDYSGYGDTVEIREVDEDVVDFLKKHNLI